MMNNNTQTLSKFHPGMTVSYSKFSGCVMPGVKAEIISGSFCTGSGLKLCQTTNELAVFRTALEIHGL
ncbi:hypothetical protein WA1_49090 [Scytonema hofmannii PCC 7110]|uniref:Uncharacterized protein n=1 Tax=Scytonema hofmannii PCC 7110 TaxID=128403 RepID=A0A139WQJ4_9CYAN|nr:hypothetical protein [Scytonema hofmannii]KYC34698.1 hypothetical protein WA1_49090 [Scytonema hofmannii PCC 7110]